MIADIAAHAGFRGYLWFVWFFSLSLSDSIFWFQLNSHFGDAVIL